MLRQIFFRDTESSNLDSNFTKNIRITLHLYLNNAENLQKRNEKESICSVMTLIPPICVDVNFPARLDQWNQLGDTNLIRREPPPPSPLCNNDAAMFLADCGFFNRKEGRGHFGLMNGIICLKLYYRKVCCIQFCNIQRSTFETVLLGVSCS